MNSPGLAPKSRLLLAISGGADSTAMAVIFRILAKRQTFELHALHVDHSLREASAADAIFTQELCSSLEIELQTVKIDVRRIAEELHTGIEDAARKERYRQLELRRAGIGADHILLAHHLGDLCEDILLRLIRGAAWPALGGMRAKDAKRRIMRPLLRIDGQKLREFLSALHIPWREDESNFSMDFRRNRIRHQILPLLERENPSLKRALLHLHEISLADEDYWDYALREALRRNPWLEQLDADPPALILPKELLAALSKAARLRLYRKAVNFMKSNAPCNCQPRADIFFRLDAALLEGRSGLFQLPGGLDAVVKGRAVVFLAQERQEQKKNPQK